MSDSEAVRRRLDALRLLPDVDASARHLCQQWTTLMQELNALTPADGERARALITTGFSIRDSLRYILGPCNQVDHGLHLALHHQSLRLLGEGRPPGWKPD